MLLPFVIWQVTTDTWERSYPVTDSTVPKEITGIESDPANTSLSASMDSHVSSALKGREGGAGHNAAESSGHFAAANSITTTSSIGEVVKHPRNTIVSTVLFAR